MKSFAFGFAGLAGGIALLVLLGSPGERGDAVLVRPARGAGRAEVPVSFATETIAAARTTEGVPANDPGAGPSGGGQEPGEPAADARDADEHATEASLDASPERKDRVNGPRLEGWHANGEPHFRGSQLRGSDGRWQRWGDWEAWHENGTLHELGAYRADGEHGPWKWWYESGLPMAEGHFDEGERVGEWRWWHENGELQMVGGYDAGVRSGWWTYWSEAGVKVAEGAFADGERDGRWTVYRSTGEVDEERSRTYAAGQPVDGTGD